MAIYTHQQIQAMLKQAGFPDIVVDTYIFNPKKASGVKTFDGKKPLLALMSAICDGESSLNSNATNCRNPRLECSIGLFQINTNVHKRYSIEQLKNPNINLQETVRIYRERNNPTAWGAYTDGRYKLFYAKALNAYNGGVSIPNNTTGIINAPKPLKDLSELSDTNKAILYGGIGLIVLLLITR